MRTLTLKVLPFTEAHAPLDYRDLLLLLLQSPAGTQGMLAAEVRERTTIQRQIMEATDTVTIDEPTYVLLIGLAETYLWGSATLQLEQFLDDLHNAPTDSIRH